MSTNDILPENEVLSFRAAAIIVFSVAVSIVFLMSDFIFARKEVLEGVIVEVHSQHPTNAPTEVKSQAMVRLSDGTKFWAPLKHTILFDPAIGSRVEVVTTLGCVSGFNYSTKISHESN